MNSPKKQQIASKGTLETDDPLLEDFLSFNDDPPAILLMRGHRRNAQ